MLFYTEPGSAALMQCFVLHRGGAVLWHLNLNVVIQWWEHDVTARRSVVGVAFKAVNSTRSTLHASPQFPRSGDSNDPTQLRRLFAHGGSHVCLHLGWGCGV